MKMGLAKMKLTPINPWISIYQSKFSHSIEIVKMRLQDEDIPVQIWNQMDSSYQAFGEIHINVKKEDEERAKRIIDELE